MTRLDDYRSALLAGFADVPRDELVAVLREARPGFAPFVIDHGLGPLWHLRTESADFRASRLSAEALYAAQDNALGELHRLLTDAGIDHAVFKGAATRLLLYENPAIRACHDIDILVRPAQKVQAAAVLVGAGFKAFPDPFNVGHEMTLARGLIEVDLHWGLLREGRLRRDCSDELLDRRRKAKGVWMLGAEDDFLVLLVHPAFSKHLGGREMGLHRVLDVVTWLRTQSFDWPRVREQLGALGVTTAAWATLQWVGLLGTPHVPEELDAMLSDLRPGAIRAAWINGWLQGNLSERTANARWARLLGLSLFLHDTPADACRALAGRRRASQRQERDLAAFGELLGQ